MNWNEYLEACKAWEAGRREAVIEAHMAMRRKAGNTNHVLQYEDLGYRAGIAAGAEYERQVLRPAWEGVPGFCNTARLLYIREADLPLAARSDLVS
ncbi:MULTISPECIES: hypothetical protein [unclassified Streptomyces]|uniref:hypothetical protein n=1 Tax=unclassified Streptomyces TaxID=2593676 RepID=UPI00224F1205|nr:hypothetical protein [Streptomyces sp. NBC_01571]MCX4573088.1 hypothetical protein [Streptomyces sp. NBC_01571]